MARRFLGKGVQTALLKQPYEGSPTMTKDRDRDADSPPVVEDAGTTDMPGDEVANAAARSLHGDKARPETNEQPDAAMLPGGTLIAKPADGDDQR
jgi:hypothetical protein